MNKSIENFYKLLQIRQKDLEEEVKAHGHNPIWIGRLKEAQRIFDEFIEIFELPF